MWGTGRWPKQGLPCWLSGRESACQYRSRGFDSWFWKIPHAEEQLGLCAATAEPVLSDWTPVYAGAHAPQEQLRQWGAPHCTWRAVPTLGSCRKPCRSDAPAQPRSTVSKTVTDMEHQNNGACSYKTRERGAASGRGQGLGSQPRERKGGRTWVQLGYWRPQGSAWWPGRVRRAHWKAGLWEPWNNYSIVLHSEQTWNILLFQRSRMWEMCVGVGRKSTNMNKCWEHLICMDYFHMKTLRFTERKVNSFGALFSSHFQKEPLLKSLAVNP